MVVMTVSLMHSKAAGNGTFPVASQAAAVLLHRAASRSCKAILRPDNTSGAG